MIWKHLTCNWWLYGADKPNHNMDPVTLTLTSRSPKFDTAKRLTYISILPSRITIPIIFSPLLCRQGIVWRRRRRRRRFRRELRQNLYVSPLLRRGLHNKVSCETNYPPFISNFRIICTYVVNILFTLILTLKTPDTSVARFCPL